MIFDEVKALVDIIKEAKNYAQEKQNSEFSEKLLDIYSKMIDIKAEISDLQDENKELKNQLAKKDELRYGNEAYFKKLENGEWDKPLCKECQEVEHRQVYLQFKTDDGYYYQCLYHEGLSRVVKETDIKTPNGETPKRPY